MDFELESVTPVYLMGLHLKNIRCFKNFELRIEHDGLPRMKSVIIGRNGTCKSTLLRSIALGLVGPECCGHLINAFSGRDDMGSSSLLVTEGAEIGTITLEVRNGNGESHVISLEVKRHDDDREELANFHSTIPNVPIVDRKSGVHFVCGFGAERSLSYQSGYAMGLQVFDTVAGLFWPTHYQGLLALDEIQDHLGESAFKLVLRRIEQALGLSDEHRIHIHAHRGLVISGPGFGNNIPLHGWADGYRLTFAWIMEVYYFAILATTVSETGSVRGVLLIDEIEQHLHPSMQVDILATLRRALPEMQIFCTTHSPIVALNTSAKEDLVALHREGDEVFAVATPSLHGYAADDMLLEKTLFGTDPYSSTSRVKIERYHQLSSIPAAKRLDEEASELQGLVEQLYPERLPGLREDPLVRKIESVLERLIGDHRDDKD